MPSIAAVEETRSVEVFSLDVVHPDIHASYRVFQKGVKDRLRKGVRLVSERRSGRSWNQIAGANKISVAEARVGGLASARKAESRRSSLGCEVEAGSPLSLATETFWSEGSALAKSGEQWLDIDW